MFALEKRYDSEKPLVALESTVIAHGLPRPINIKTALDMEETVRNNGATPVTIGILNGRVILGLSSQEIEILASSDSVKAGVREILYVVAKKLNGDTTVSATMRLAKLGGIDVFVTGGIGGVHRGTIDISQDLIELSRTRMIVVSAGAKSILDLKATVEILETLGVVVVGYKTDEFPAFYSRKSGIKLNMTAESVQEIVKIYEKMEDMDYEGALLVVNPIPEKDEIHYEVVEEWIKKADRKAVESGISGKDLTPFLLNEISNLSGEKSVKTNISLLLNNAALGAKIARSLKAHLK